MNPDEPCKLLVLSEPQEVESFEATVSQTHNHAGGDIVGGSKKTYNNIFGTPAPSSQIGRLLEEYLKEVECNKQTGEKLRELERWGEAKESPLIPIEDKLKEGKREELLGFALETKEIFAKKLARNTHFSSAQKIHSHLLARIWSIFQTRILPQIRAGQPALVIERLIQSEIIDPTLNDLRENPFEYTDMEVQGMIYYLTGNCHIRWA